MGVLFLLILIAGVTCQDHFYFSKHPSETTATVGSSVTLECEVSHGNDTISYWNLNGTRVLDSPRRHQIGRNLHITRAQLVEDVGEYACIAENATSRFSVTSRPARLNVVWLGNVSVQQIGPEIKPGGDLVLKCSVDGSAEIKYEWYRNGQPLAKSERIHGRNNKAQLTIRDISFADNGVYTCGSSNDAGSVRTADGVVVHLRGPHTPNVVQVPRSTNVRRGDTATFDCSFESAHEVQWFFNGVRFSSSSRRFIHDNGTLVISKVRSNDEGMYLCTGFHRKTNSVEYLESYSANLTVAYLDDLTLQSFEPALTSPTLIVPLHGRLDLTCLRPAGTPLPTVTWVDHRSSVLPGETLLVDTVKETNSGNFTCIIENFASSKKFTVTILVAVAPKPERESRTVAVDEAAALALLCPYRGSPAPATTFHWRKDGRLLSNYADVSPQNGTLSIHGVQPADRGSYVCQINTEGFPTAENAPLHVIVRELLRFAPRPVSKNLELGSQGRIHCKAQGTPTPDVRWVLGTKDSQQPLPSHLSDVNGTLRFHNATMADRGTYTCIANNGQGSIDATIDIDVIVSPSFTVIPQNSTEVQEGQPLSIHCMADGDPRPKITWDKDGDLYGLDKSRFQMLDNGTLIISTVFKHDHGRYGCIAGNTGGFKRLETELIVRGVEELEELEEESMMTRTVVITLSAAAGYMALVVGLMVWCRYRRRRRKQAYLHENPEGILLAKAENGEVKTDKCEENGKRVGVDGLCERQADGAEAAHSQSSGHSRRSNRTLSYDKITFPRHNLRDLKLLGHGMFGQVQVGRTEPNKQIVVVKSLQNTRDESSLAEFRREIDMFHRLSHENVARLIGLCRETDPHFLILEYTDWGDLKQFLQSTKKERSKLSVSQLLDLAMQVSVGMEHLSNSRFVHRDLAARNCLVSSDLKVKVSLIALTRDVHSADYAVVRNQTVPLRWLPAEAVLEDEYSNKSDVYSFAVLCWELFHQGDRPHSNLTDDQVMERLPRREFTVRPSKHSPPAVAALLTACAAYSPKDRPTFSSIAVTITEVLSEM